LLNHGPLLDEEAGFDVLGACSRVSSPPPMTLRLILSCRRMITKRKTTRYEGTGLFLVTGKYKMNSKDMLPWSTYL
jgi:hypothetical protein